MAHAVSLSNGFEYAFTNELIKNGVFPLSQLLFVPIEIEDWVLWAATMGF